MVGICQDLIMKIFITDLQLRKIRNNLMYDKGLYK